MALTDYKIKDSDVSTYGVVAAPDNMKGDPAANKAVFDRLIREKVKIYVNGLIDALAAPSGAGELGALGVDGTTASTVQAVIVALKILIDACETQAAATSTFALKEDKTVTAQHYKAVTFDTNTGIFTFTRENGSTTSIDTALEKVATNWAYDAAAQSLILALADGSTQNISLSAFITENEYLDSDTLDFSVSDHKITATIKTGSITDEMLASALKNTLQNYVTQAGTSATNAAASEANAQIYKNAAQAAQTAAVNAQTAAETAQEDAEVSATNAAASETSAGTSETNAGNHALDSEAWAVGKRGGVDVGSSDPAYHNNSKYYKDQAQEIVGGDYATKTEAQNYVDTHNAAVDAHSDLFAGKANKKVPTAAGNLAALDADGNLTDSGKTVTEVLQGADAKTLVNVAGTTATIGQLTPLSSARYNLAAATDGNGNVLFGGGYDSGYSAVVDKYDLNWIHTTLTPLSVARYNLAAATDGNGNVLFGGGFHSAAVDKYDVSGTHTTLTSLSAARDTLAAATDGNGNVLFGGGETENYPYFSAVVDKYDVSGTHTTLTSLSVARRELAASSDGNGNVLFGGGFDGNSGSAVVDKYDPSGVRTTLKNRTLADAVNTVAFEVQQKDPDINTIYQAFEKLWNESTMTVPADAAYKEAADALKGRKIYVNDSIRTDIGDNWRSVAAKARRYGISFTKDINDRGVDVLNQEMAGSYPGLFDKTSTDGGDMVYNLLDIMERSKDVTTDLPTGLENLYGKDTSGQAMTEQYKKFMQAANEMHAATKSGLQARREAIQEKRENNTPEKQLARARQEAAKEPPKTTTAIDKVTGKYPIVSDISYSGANGMVDREKAAYKVKKLVEKMEKDLNPTPQEKAFAKDMASGLYITRTIYRNCGRSPRH